MPTQYQSRTDAPPSTALPAPTTTITGSSVTGKPQTWCDLCGSALPKVKDPKEDLFFYDCYVHPFWKEKQILCPDCASTNVECCFSCEFKIRVEDIPTARHTKEGYICSNCMISAPVTHFKEAYLIKQHLIVRMTILLNLTPDIKFALTKLPVRVKSNTRHVLDLANNMDCDTWNDFRTLFGFCSFEKFDPERILVREIVILKGLPRILFTKVLAHELFHCVMCIKKQEILTFPPAQRSILKLASEGNFGEYCDDTESYRQLEEAACHLFAAELLSKTKTYSDHETCLKQLWLYKLLPTQDSERQSPALSDRVLALWNNLCDRKLSPNLLSITERKSAIRYEIWEQVVEELVSLKCVWDLG